MLTQELISKLQCPTCREGGLRTSGGASGDGSRLPEQGELVCDGCDSTYPVHHGFPVLIPESELTGADWQLWSDHLDKLQARREARVRNSSDTIARLSRGPSLQSQFARFTGISEGRVLDIGCGPGKFRRHLDETRVEYVGLDPIALPEVTEFPFVQGLAERIPFSDGTFTDVVVLAALDHFQDLDTFFGEASRVLGREGRLHVMQSVHEVRGPLSAIRMMGHKVKDALEDRAVDADSAVPKHLIEFTTRSLLERTCSNFDVRAIDEYAATWYSPTNLFLSFTPAAEVIARSA